MKFYSVWRGKFLRLLSRVCGNHNGKILVSLREFIGIFKAVIKVNEDPPIFR